MIYDEKKQKENLNKWNVFLIVHLSIKIFFLEILQIVERNTFRKLLFLLTVYIFDILNQSYLGIKNFCISVLYWILLCQLSLV